MNEVLRQEKKYLISIDQYYRLSSYISEIMHEDSHNNGDGYKIRSLYFDTIYNRDFFDKENGVELRRKFRLRNYGADSQFAMLEMKQKQGELQKKRSLRVTKDDAYRIIQKDYSVLLKYNDPFAEECYALMNMYGYMPKTVVDYKRKAFIANENSTRITFDYDIRATESTFDIFSSELVQYPVMNNHLAVLEVKYNGFLLSYLKDLLESRVGRENAVSKYCMARQVSMHYNF